jgi:ArsR family transcriptional regulator, arsenate/arsenite/antimonite-responsive transcriptional repressor
MTEKVITENTFMLETAATAKALSHPARCAILSILAKHKYCNAMDIVVSLPLSQSTVSQHLKELKDAGLIKGVPDGTRMKYSLRKKAMEKAEKRMRRFFRKLDGFDL